jgi:adenine phosphoribosyltransferase
MAEPVREPVRGPLGEPVDELVRRLVREVPDYPLPGVLFKDITPLLADPTGFAATVDALAGRWQDEAVDLVVGIEARGFILAAPVAYRLGAGFVPVRKSGKLPSATYRQSYALEYGDASVEVHVDSFVPGARVLVVDDVLATGGTAAATVDLVRRGGGHVVGLGVLIELGFLHGRDKIGDVPLHSVLIA